jgi:hypothetical protein
MKRTLHFNNPTNKVALSGCVSAGSSAEQLKSRC